MTVLYSREKTEKHKRTEGRLMGGMIALFAGVLLACIALCFVINSRNAKWILIAQIASSALAGWGEMIVYFCIYAPLKALRRHEEGILEQEKKEETVFEEGEFIVSKDAISLPKSITIVVCRLKTQTKAEKVHVPILKRDMLPQNGARVRMRRVRGYVYAWEEAK